MALWFALMVGVAFSASPGFIQQTAAAFDPPAIRVGEKLHFDIFWSIFRVGEAQMEALPNVDVMGSATRHFRLTIRTRGFIDAIYAVDTRIDAFTSLPIRRSMGYRKKQREADIVKDDEITFDWEKMQARLHRGGEDHQAIDILPGTFDPLGILYFARTQAYRIPNTIQRPVTDGRRCEIGRLGPVHRELLALNGMVHDTIVIRSQMDNIDGLFEASRSARFTLWLATDPARTPLKISIDFFLGSIDCRLRSAFLPKGRDQRIDRQQTDGNGHGDQPSRR